MRAVGNENLLEDVTNLPSMEDVPPTPEENDLIDQWIATESSSRRHAEKHGRESLLPIARRELATARNRELTLRARGMPGWAAASAADHMLLGLDP